MQTCRQLKLESVIVFCPQSLPWRGRTTSTVGDERDTLREETNAPTTPAIDSAAVYGHNRYHLFTSRNYRKNIGELSEKPTWRNPGNFHRNLIVALNGWRHVAGWGMSGRWGMLNREIAVQPFSAKSVNWTYISVITIEYFVTVGCSVGIPSGLHGYLWFHLINQSPGKRLIFHTTPKQERFQLHRVYVTCEALQLTE